MIHTINYDDYTPTIKKYSSQLVILLVFNTRCTEFLKRDWERIAEVVRMMNVSSLV